MMGQASRRGTFEQRKEKSIERKKETAGVVLDNLGQVETKLSLKEIRQQMEIMLLVNSAKRLGLTPKELKRKLKRDNKKRI